MTAIGRLLFELRCLADENPNLATELRRIAALIEHEYNTMDISEEFIKLREENKKLRAILSGYGLADSLFNADQKNKLPNDLPP